MREYLKAAFWAGVDLPGLGRVPVNVLLVAACGILGFANPGFWLLGAAGEAVLLTALATNPRFQRAVDASRQSAAEGDAELHRQELVRRLDPPARQRYAALEDKCARVLAAQQEAQAPEIGVESSRDALSRLSWIYLKLLVARFHLQASRVQVSEADLRRQLAELKRALAATGQSAALRQSQAATEKILEQRLQNLERCQQTQQEVDADLGRIEAQVDLALDNANLSGGGAVVSANLELASQILDDGLYFGDSERDVAALDETYRPAPPAAVRTGAGGSGGGTEGGGGAGGAGVERPGSGARQSR
jgi:hypothetical protein